MFHRTLHKNSLVCRPALLNPVIVINTCIFVDHCNDTTSASGTAPSASDRFDSLVEIYQISRHSLLVSDGNDRFFTLMTQSSATVANSYMYFLVCQLKEFTTVVKLIHLPQFVLVQTRPSIGSILLCTLIANEGIVCAVY